MLLMTVSAGQEGSAIQVTYTKTWDYEKIRHCGTDGAFVLYDGGIGPGFYSGTA